MILQCHETSNHSSMSPAKDLDVPRYLAHIFLIVSQIIHMSCRTKCEPQRYQAKRSLCGRWLLREFTPWGRLLSLVLLVTSGCSRGLCPARWGKRDPANIISWLLSTCPGDGGVREAQPLLSQFTISWKMGVVERRELDRLYSGCCMWLKVNP